MTSWIGWRRLGVASTACLLAAALASVAGAEIPSADEIQKDPQKYATPYRDVGDDVHGAAGVDADTDHTPRAKETDLWKLVAGAKFGEDRAAYEARAGDQALTDFDDNLYTVAFSELAGVGGLAGGASCEVSEPNKERDCAPVIYQYKSFDTARGVEWRKVKLPNAQGRSDVGPGYVGAIAWIPNTKKAIAVGGTGTYPRRELAWEKDQTKADCAPGAQVPSGCDQFGRSNRACGETGNTENPPHDCRSTDPDKADVAGKARAWLYANGSWSEFDLSTLTEDRPFTVPAKPITVPTGLGSSAPATVPGLGTTPGHIPGPLHMPNPSPSGNPSLGDRRDCLDPTKRGGTQSGGSTCPKEPAPGSGQDVSDPISPGATPEQKSGRAGMRGLTALDCDPYPGRERCFAGGLGQIWDWKDGRFIGMGDSAESSVDALTPHPPDVKPLLSRFRFRVRQIRFVSGRTGHFADKPIVAAVTAGCCVESALANEPLVLVYGPTRPGTYGWTANPLRVDHRTNAARGSTNIADGVNVHQGHRPDSFYSVMVRPGPSQDEFKLSAIASTGAPASTNAPEPPSQFTSRYCLPNGGNYTSGLSFGTELHGVPSDASDLTRANLSTARLVAGDGDQSADSFPLPRQDTDVHVYEPTRGSPATFSPSGFCGANEYGAPPAPDSVPDWVVGELRSTYERDLGSRGLLVAYSLRPSLSPDALTLPAHYDERGASLLASDDIDTSSVVSPAYLRRTDTKYKAVTHEEIADGSYQPTDPDRLAKWAAAPYFLLPSYGLNAIDIVGTSASGWAVGDHGAILNLAGADAIAKGATEPAPPALGKKNSAELPNRAPYEPTRQSLASEVGTVPGLGGQPRRRLSSPELVSAGMPHATGPDTYAVQIAMSRDGSEGWAVGPGGGPGRWEPTALFHYDGRAWSACDFLGVPGVKDPDPACAAIDRIRSFTTNTGQTQSVKLRGIARVPLENDTDPSNDDEFEAVAVGTSYIPEHGQQVEVPAVLRYRDGRWRFEGDFEDQGRGIRAAIDTQSAGTSNDPDGGLQDVAFTASNDGWILAGDVGVTRLFRFDGELWIDCTLQPGDCGDTGRRLNPAPADGPPITASLSPYVRPGLVATGDRVYLFGTRKVGQPGPQRECPAIVYHKRGAETWSGSAAGSDGGYDPAFKSPDGCTSDQVLGLVSLAIGRRADGAYEGWAFGRTVQAGQSKVRVIRLGPGGDWSPYTPDEDAGDALADTLTSTTQAPDPSRVLMTPDGKGGLTALVAFDERFFSFDRARERWQLAGPPSDRLAAADVYAPQPPKAGPVEIVTLAPDGQGGAWAAANMGTPSGLPSQHFLHYSSQPHKPVFDKVANPAGADRVLTAASAGANGELWLATGSDTLFRYDRQTGWDRVRISGWDPGRVVTRPSEVRAIAVNEKGVGVAVGENGRIADIASRTVVLDAAAGTLCDLAAPVAPCGTGRDLRAVSVAPDGSAIVAGKNLALLWRPANGEFRAIERPDASIQTTITGVSMPTPDRAWLATATGLVFAGRLSGGHWSWTLESLNPDGGPLTIDRAGYPAPLRAIAVDAEGHGFAVGDAGTILERRPGQDPSWRRMPTPYTDNLVSVALPAGKGAGALVGSKRGGVLTWTGRDFEWARPPEACCPFEDNTDVEIDSFSGNSNRPVAGLALLPGHHDGEVEAWAVVQGGGGGDKGGAEGDSTLLHYASAEDDPLLAPGARAKPLPDAPAPRPGEIAFAAFGGSRCPDRGAGSICEPMQNSTDDYEVYAQRSVAEIAERAKVPGGPAFALFSGDANDTLGEPVTHANLKTGVKVSTGTASTERMSAGRLKLRRFNETVADRLRAAGVPFFATIGAGELTGGRTCAFGCWDVRRFASAGENLIWRREMNAQPEPWGHGRAQRPSAAEGLQFKPAPGGSGPTVDLDRQGLGDVKVQNPADGSEAGQTRLRAGGARTHYALDVLRGKQKLMRLVFVDTSLRSLSAGDAIQNPIEARGQSAWLEQMLCLKGGQSTTATGRCTREPGQQAIVVSNAPSYTYGPGRNETLVDANQFETILMRHATNLVVAGRIGWNGLYWATNAVAGIHEPCPGGAYQQAPPPPNTNSCNGRSTADLPVNPSAIAPAAQGVADALSSAAPPPPPGLRDAQDQIAGQAGQSFSDILPFVVASGGGKFSQESSPDAPDAASKGLWHGYTIVRLDASGDPRATIVEQRPLFDWLHISGPSHVLGAGQKMVLRGFGREPIATASVIERFYEVRDDRIDSPAITHRYDLVEADPEKPYLPKTDADGGYVPLDPAIGTIDSQTGVVKAGKGSHPRVLALAILSVGKLATTYPISFEPRRSFVPPRPPAPQAPPARVSVQAAAPQPPAPSPPPNFPGTPPINVPAPPTLSPPPPPGTPLQVKLPQLTVPPAPPVPPAVLPIQVTPTAISVAILPLPGVFPQPAPPINPAPPSGARREARQRQAATEKSGSDSGAGDAKELGGDLAQHPASPDAAPMTRRDRVKPEGSFTTVHHADQPSAWTRGALYGGGLTLAALMLAGGFAGPRPRRKSPPVPSPVWQKGDS